MCGIVWPRDENIEDMIRVSLMPYQNVAIISAILMDCPLNVKVDVGNMAENFVLESRLQIKSLYNLMSYSANV